MFCGFGKFSGGLTLDADRILMGPTTNPHGPVRGLNDLGVEASTVRNPVRGVDAGGRSAGETEAVRVKPNVTVKH